MYENLENIGFTPQNIGNILKTIAYFSSRLDKYRYNDKKYKEIKVAIPNYVIKMLLILAELGSENLKLKKNKIYVCGYEVVTNYNDTIVVFNQNSVINKKIKDRFYFCIEMKEIFKNTEYIENDLYLREREYIKTTF